MPCKLLKAHMPPKRKFETSTAAVEYRHLFEAYNFILDRLRIEEQEDEYIRWRERRRRVMAQFRVFEYEVNQGLQRMHDEIERVLLVENNNPGQTPPWIPVFPPNIQPRPGVNLSAIEEELAPSPLLPTRQLSPVSPLLSPLPSPSQQEVILSYLYSSEDGEKEKEKEK